MYKKDILDIAALQLPWRKLTGTNIFVTGATGLIGGCLIEALMMNPQRDYNVYASGRNEEAARKRFKDFYNDEKFHFISHDVLNPMTCDIPFDYIIHAASNASPNFFSQIKYRWCRKFNGIWTTTWNEALFVYIVRRGIWRG